MIECRTPKTSTPNALDIFETSIFQEAPTFNLQRRLDNESTAPFAAAFVTTSTESKWNIDNTDVNMLVSVNKLGQFWINISDTFFKTITFLNFHVSNFSHYDLVGHPLSDFRLQSSRENIDTPRNTWWFMTHKLWVFYFSPFFMWFDISHNKYFYVKW